MSKEVTLLFLVLHNKNQGSQTTRLLKHRERQAEHLKMFHVQPQQNGKSLNLQLDIKVQGESFTKQSSRSFQQTRIKKINKRKSFKGLKKKISIDIRKVQSHLLSLVKDSLIRVTRVSREVMTKTPSSPRIMMKSLWFRNSLKMKEIYKNQRTINSSNLESLMRIR